MNVWNKILRIFIKPKRRKMTAIRMRKIYEDCHHVWEKEKHIFQACMDSVLEDEICYNCLGRKSSYYDMLGGFEYIYPLYGEPKEDDKRGDR